MPYIDNNKFRLPLFWTAFYIDCTCPENSGSALNIKLLSDKSSYSQATSGIRFKTWVKYYLDSCWDEKCMLFPFFEPSFKRAASGLIIKLWSDEKGMEKHPLHPKGYFTLLFRENKELLAFSLLLKSKPNASQTALFSIATQ